MEKARKDREEKQKQYLEEKRRKQEELQKIKQEEKLRKLQELELKRQQAAIFKEQVGTFVVDTVQCSHCQVSGIFYATSAYRVQKPDAQNFTSKKTFNR